VYRPKFIGIIKDYFNLRRGLSNLKRIAAESSSIEECVRKTQAVPIFFSTQKESEIAALLKILAQDPPRYILDIGTGLAGTLFLFAQVAYPDACIISVDINLGRKRKIIYPKLGKASQRIICIRGNSRSPEVIKRIRSLFGNIKIDFLFLDGDHTYEGVKTDFLNYVPLVRKGGLVALHDIMFDFRTRFGVCTDAYTGGVPTYWQEVKSQYQTKELIDNPGQDGYGIGLVFL
jgi:cephalosporin hydroxylase